MKLYSPGCIDNNKQMKLYSSGCIDNNKQMKLYSPGCIDNNKQMKLCSFGCMANIKQMMLYPLCAWKMIHKKLVVAHVTNYCGNTFGSMTKEQ